VHKSPGKSPGKPVARPKQRIAILGLGLMGGSLGLALRRRGFFVAGYARRAETRKQALRIGAVDKIFDTPQDAAVKADIVVICSPVLSVANLARACMPALSAKTIVTDVGSTKNHLRGKMATLGIRFIGSHPIAGSEQQGIEAARADLYKGAVVVITPPPRTDRRLVGRIARLWTSAGAGTVLVMQASEHDRLIAVTSHLPHLLSSMLVKHVHDNGTGNSRQLCGSGFRDVTRIADGSPEMWHDIVATNAGPILCELDKFRSLLDKYRALIAKKDFEGIRRLLDQSRKQRRTLLGQEEV